MSDVVPFGKYKGQPVEAMAQDRKYVEWLTAQSWFRDRYQTIYNVVVNNFQEPSETPEHNRLQVLFLRETFQKAFMQRVFDITFEKFEVSFECDGFDVYLRGKGDWGLDKNKLEGWNTYESCHVEIKPVVADDYPAVFRQIKLARHNAKHGADKTVLFLERYIGVGATEDQFIAFFESENIEIIFLDEVT